MSQKTIGASLRSQGISRRGFLKFCAATASMLALPPAVIPQIAHALENAKRQSVIWLSFQECTGCTESLTRSHAPTLENLVFDLLSLDYHHTLQAASGDAAEHARELAMEANKGEYLLIVDGSIPTANKGYSTIAGISNIDMFHEVAKDAKAIVAVGTCAAYGGLPKAEPNPTGAVSVEDLITDKPVINVPGCPPIPMVITGIVAHFLTFNTLPELDSLKRPLSFYGQNIHDRCYRRPFYERAQFAETFDDEGAKKGWCLYKLGCKGPTTYNACATAKWNEGVSFPIEAGHGCIGCSEPDFWDAGSFYKALSVPLSGTAQAAGYAVAAGAAMGVAAGAMNMAKRNSARKTHETVSIDDLEREQS
ncbi:hydrogenase small subunit [Candidatus Albibeggiatoa sp. nov. NOAA]|uniref:hydrogenase small subunit n=1 Tax=Candidatus Albibeggiatoa sp. nov. NOAA TaxID=3162724 RepID=UPI0032F731D3|nr:hydrogenase small subunit [Thiotrichaceae bacterium]